MRKLQGKDMFVVAKIIKKAEVKDKLVDMMNTKEKDVAKVGVKAFMTIIEGCANEGVDKEVFAFLDDILEVKDTLSMDIFELIELIKAYAKENDLKRFLSLVGSTI